VTAAIVGVALVLLVAGGVIIYTGLRRGPGDE
jgi:hypothetical protein